MSQKETKKDIEIIIQYNDDMEVKEDRNLQHLLQRLFNLYLTKKIQNIDKGK